MADIERDLLQRQLAWTLAALDLCLDMERNEADGAFAASGGEIVYVFDEDVFELFVSGWNEYQGTGADRVQIYRDRRQSVGVFNTRLWRKKQISRVEEDTRALINRQSMILTGEYLISSPLPGMKDGRIYMSRQHLSELDRRWDYLVEYYRSLILQRGGCPEELERILALDEDMAFKALTAPEAPVTTEDVDTYLRSQPPVLREDLEKLRRALSQVRTPSAGSYEAPGRDFWSYAFSRRLADELAKLRVTQPFGQLKRIHSELSPRLEFLHTAAELDEPEGDSNVRRSETPAFWLKSIRTLAQERNHKRSDAALRNDAQTLALVQAFANAASYSKDRRFVFVTSDVVLIEAYREWHCTAALDGEHFVVRSTRQYAPLLNIHDMAEGDGSSEAALKEDIFKRLRDAIEPLLLKLNLSAASEGNRQLNKRSGTPPHVQGDTVRRTREHFSLRLRQVLARLEREATGEAGGPVMSREELLSEVVNLSIFTDPSPNLAAIDRELEEISELGRAIERAAIGFGSPWLSARLNSLRPIQELQRKVAAGDESALARFVADMVEEFDDASLTVRVRFFDITAELESVAEKQRRAARRRVPLLLQLFFERDGVRVNLAIEALERINVAGSGAAHEAKTPTFEQERDWAIHSGGYRLFALYSCIALYLEKWDTAYRCAVNARRRARTASKSEHDELDYLLALSIRFRLGAGPIRDAGQSDVTAREFLKVEQILKTEVESGLASFTTLRAAAELSSLQLFSCAWALAGANGATDARQPAGFDLEFGASRLTAACKLLASLWPHVARAQDDGIVQLRRHAAINFAAAECFAAKFATLGWERVASECRNEIGGILDEPLLSAMVDEWEKAPGWRPAIGFTLFGWARFVRGWGPPPSQAVGPDLTLPVDQRVATFLEGLLGPADVAGR
ncbi:MAG TPA: hypothetical protein VGC56_07200 [Allosphingosinicella sp.]